MASEPSSPAGRSDVVALTGLATSSRSSTGQPGERGEISTAIPAIDVLAGERIADGQVPYRDFLYYYGPLAPALNGLFALLGGPGFAPAIALGFVIALATIAATYAVARIVVGPLGALLASVITAAVAFIPDDFSYVLPHTGDATLGGFLLLGFAPRRVPLGARPKPRGRGRDRISPRPPRADQARAGRRRIRRRRRLAPRSAADRLRSTRGNRRCGAAGDCDPRVVYGTLCWRSSPSRGCSSRISIPGTFSREIPSSGAGSR